MTTAAGDAPLTARLVESPCGPVACLGPVPLRAFPVSFIVYTADPRDEHYHCFGCGAHGRLRDWLKEWGGEDRPPPRRAPLPRVSAPDEPWWMAPPARRMAGRAKEGAEGRA